LGGHYSLVAKKEKGQTYRENGKHKSLEKRL
jgi:hypothetical protein